MPKQLAERLDTARLLIKQISNKGFRDRAEQLLANPSDLSQTDFGVCGLAAIIYTLLMYRPDKFAALALEIFRDRSLIKELRTLYWSGNPSRTPPFDYVVMAGLAYRSRASAQLVSIVVWDDANTPRPKLKRAREAFDRSVEFSRTFEVDGKVWTPEDSGGHFATTQSSVAEIMATVLPNASIYKFAPTIPISQVIMDINRYFKIYKTAFAFMGIKACDEWMKLSSIAEATAQQKLSKWAPVLTTPQPKFEHWVWLSGPIVTINGGYRFDFWTWRDKYSVEIASKLLRDYIHGFVAGHVDMSFQ